MLGRLKMCKRHWWLKIDQATGPRGMVPFRHQFAAALWNRRPTSCTIHPGIRQPEIPHSRYRSSRAWKDCEGFVLAGRKVREWWGVSVVSESVGEELLLVDSQLRSIRCYLAKLYSTGGSDS